MNPSSTGQSDPPGSPASLRDAAIAVVRRLQAHGHVAYFAGGCVRDALLGLAPKDYDVATDAHPQVVRKLFPGSRYVGEAFGVVLVPARKVAAVDSTHAIEVATFRRESGYEDGRRPTQVAFCNAREDAARRDFTINGLFENPLATRPADRIVDYVNGQADLKAGVIRAIGQADHRFGEDYLRMLRAVRFAARFDFDIDPDTAAAIRQHAGKLVRISRERIGMEVAAMLKDRHRVAALTWLDQLGLDGPTLDASPAKGDMVYRVTAAMPDDADYPALLAAWIFDRRIAAALHTVDVNTSTWHETLRQWLDDHLKTTVRRFRRALCLTNECCHVLAAVLDHLPDLGQWRAMALSRQKRLLAQPWQPALWQFARALAAALHWRDWQAIDGHAQGLLREGVSPKPLLDGHDLISLGIQPGPRYKMLLDAAYDRQLEGDLIDHAQAMAWLKTQV